MDLFGTQISHAFRIFFIFPERVETLFAATERKSIFANIINFTMKCLYMSVSALFCISTYGLCYTICDELIIFCVIFYNLLHFPLIHPHTFISSDSFDNKDSIEENLMLSLSHEEMTTRNIFNCNHHWSQWISFVIFNIFTIIHYSDYFGIQYDVFKYVLFFLNPVTLVFAYFPCTLVLIFLRHIFRHKN